MEEARVMITGISAAASTLACVFFVQDDELSSSAWLSAGFPNTRSSSLRPVDMIAWAPK
jgi:hypothetical protein